MAKYRKKPIVIDAEQWFPGKQVDGVCTGECRPGIEVTAAHVHTLEGPLDVVPGAWIVTGTTGERWPVRNDIFEASYEPHG